MLPLVGWWSAGGPLVVVEGSSEGTLKSLPGYNGAKVPSPKTRGVEAKLMEKSEYDCIVTFLRTKTLTSGLTKNQKEEDTRILIIDGLLY